MRERVIGADPSGEFLLRANLVDARSLKELEQAHQENGGRLVDILIGTGRLSVGQVLEGLAQRLGIPYLERIEQDSIQPAALAVLTPEECRDLEVLPLRCDRSTLWLAVTDPLDVHKMDDIRFMTGKRVELVLVSRDEMLGAHAALFPEALEIENQLREIGDSEPEVVTQELVEEHLDLSEVESAGHAPVVALVNLILKQGIVSAASDIHLEPKENHVRVRYRLDGVLVEQPPLRAHYRAAVITRIKVLARLDISEKRIPQDGAFTVKLQGTRRVDLRVSAFPTAFGQKLVLRILDKAATRKRMDDLGFPKRVGQGVRELMAYHEGVFLVTGPTGSGKSTTLYTLLGEIDTPERNIVTLEDPVEYQMETLTQGQTNVKAGFTFASGLRSILRQDPDVILVGEIRDLETARIAVQASLTGHLVFSTLHTNSAPEAVVRLLDMGLEPFLISAAMRGALAQRLARRLCKECREPFSPPQDMLEMLAVNGVAVGPHPVFYRPKGCKSCNLGYKGRLGIYELFRMTKEAQRVVARGADQRELLRSARKDGFRTLRQNGLEKVVEGATTLEEVYRVTSQDGEDEAL